jgi:hypothetical protein
MNEGLDPLVGRWVMVHMRSADGFQAARHLEYGILEAYDGGWVYVRRPEGDVVCLAINGIYALREIELPEDHPARVLLRPTDAPSGADTLGRPAAPGGPAGTSYLVRPAPVAPGGPPRKKTKRRR